jgi:hypothetical protein
MPRYGYVASAATAAWVASATLFPAVGETIESTHSSIAEKRCKTNVTLKIDDTEYAVSRVCAGPARYKVYVDEEDLRETLTIGRTAAQAMREPAAHDRFGAFNGYEDTIEWRSPKGGVPFAAIVGWHFADNENLEKSGKPKSTRLIVVMRLPPGPVTSTPPPIRTPKCSPARPPTNAPAPSRAAPTSCKSSASAAPQSGHAFRNRTPSRTRPRREACARYGFSGTVSGLPASLTTNISTLAGSVSLALRDTAWSWPGDS